MSYSTEDIGDWSVADICMSDEAEEAVVSVKESGRGGEADENKLLTGEVLLDSGADAGGVNSQS